MTRKKIIEAAAIIQRLDEANALRATIGGGKHRLRLYAITDDDTMDNEVEVGLVLARALIDVVVTNLTVQLAALGVK